MVSTGFHPGRLLPLRKAEEGVGHQETVCRTGSTKKGTVIITATETVVTQHSLLDNVVCLYVGVEFDKTSLYAFDANAKMGERPKLACANVGILRRELEVWKSDIPGVETHTTSETLTWVSPPTVAVAGQIPALRSHRLTLEPLHSHRQRNIAGRDKGENAECSSLPSEDANMDALFSMAEADFRC
ncbi:unnamed protein product [Schistocephalus solidus]|uniref:Uncharacterized protein n=1 Tax=Schistocephalus solidus TaxID=70667 RepID=A0A183SI81_SCHSO|nr:unnamed protein product [Schistocephalus solidus]